MERQPWWEENARWQWVGRRHCRLLICPCAIKAKLQLRCDIFAPLGLAQTYFEGNLVRIRTPAWGIRILRVDRTELGGNVILRHSFAQPLSWGTRILCVDRVC